MIETPARIFVTGASGYVGRALVPRLLGRGHLVTVLLRRGSEQCRTPGLKVVLADALNASSFVNEIAPCDTLVHLVGVPRPAPWKAAQFRAVDLVSVKAAVTAAVNAGIRHFVYVSVAQPAPVMKAYIAVRSECEALIRQSGLSATILRPWYMLGPGHRWPVVLLPAYWLLERFASTRDGARRLGLLSLEQMVCALVWATEHPSDRIRIMTVPEIRDLTAAVETPVPGVAR